MSAAATVVLEADAGRDLYRYQKHDHGELSPEVGARCGAVVNALSKLVYAIQAERKAREGEGT